MELYIIRHAQSMNNAFMDDPDKRVADPDLTEVGLKQAQRVAQFLAEEMNLEELVRYRFDAPERQQHHPHQITHVYCSPMYRTLKTALPISEALDVVPEVWLDLHEHGGLFIENGDGIIEGDPGLTRSQILTEFARYMLPDNITETGWWDPAAGREDPSLASARAIRVAGTLRNRAMDEATANDKIALVSHGMFIDSLLKALWNALPNDTHYFNHYNTAVTRVDFHNNGLLSFRYVNRVTHLTPDLIT
jgi:broad specificity phosphatase PhoE